MCETLWLLPPSLANVVGNWALLIYNKYMFGLPPPLLAQRSLKPLEFPK